MYENQNGPLSWAGLLQLARICVKGGGGKRDLPTSRNGVAVAAKIYALNLRVGGGGVWGPGSP